MLKDNVVMEAKLGRLVFGLTPGTINKKYNIHDTCFSLILAIWNDDSRVSNTKVETVEINIEVEYRFVGIDKRPNDGFVSLYEPRFSVKRSDLNWESVTFQKDREDFYDDLLKITDCYVVEADIPDIEEIKTLWIAGITGNLVERDLVWMMKK